MLTLNYWISELKSHVWRCSLLQRQKTVYVRVYICIGVYIQVYMYAHTELLNWRRMCHELSPKPWSERARRARPRTSVLLLLNYWITELQQARLTGFSIVLLNYWISLLLYYWITEFKTDVSRCSGRTGTSQRATTPASTTVFLGRLTCFPFSCWILWCSLKIVTSATAACSDNVCFKRFLKAAYTSTLRPHTVSRFLAEYSASLKI